jgi:hypothetical protein
MGGTSKVRLFTQFGDTWLGDSPGGVWFCDLSEVLSVNGIVSAVTRALNRPLGKDEPVAQHSLAIADPGS